jgi:hypothetical protein
MNVRGFGVAAVFLAGCAVGGVSSQLAVPKASAQQAAALTTWEYNCQFAGDGKVTEIANRLGAQRWELTAAMSHSHGYSNGSDIYCFKRPKM